MSGIPNTMTINEEETDDHVLIINHVVPFLQPNINNTSYCIRKNVEASQDIYTRHSIKLEIHDIQIKSNILKNCKNFATYWKAMQSKRFLSRMMTY